MLERGFQNGIVLDALGNVAETCSSNIFLAKSGVVSTPVPNGSFLAGITRNRVVKLLRNAGVTVKECTVTTADLDDADELFTTGNTWFGMSRSASMAGDQASASSPNRRVRDALLTSVT